MKRVINFVLVAGLASQALVAGQGADASKVLAMVRDALGGDKKLSAVRTVTATGRSVRANGDSSAAPTDFELAMELPDKYMKKEVVAVMGNNVISRTSGFNGGGLIEVTDTPPSLGAGMMVMRFGPGGAAPGETPTPEQLEAMHRNALQSAREDFARFTLGMFASSFPVFPLQFSDAGQAESPDGKADIIAVKGADGFEAKLFVDATSHLPLMLSWMDKEPLVMRNVAGPGRAGAGGGNTVQFGGGQPMTPEQRDRLMKDMQDRMKEAEANRRRVEYRVYYSDYQDVSGVRLPFRIQRSVDGRMNEELTLEKIKVNPKIDPKTFEVSK